MGNVFSSLIDLFVSFFQIGLFTFGGGYAMIPMIQDVVLRKEWLSEQELIDFIAVSESTPGPFAINIATYVGSETVGVLGGVFATLGVVLPSFLIILVVAKFYEKFRKQRLLSDALTGIKPAVIGLIAAACYSIVLKAFFPAGFSVSVISSYEFISSVVIAILLFIAKRYKWKAIAIVASSAVLGILAGLINDVIK